MVSVEQILETEFQLLTYGRLLSYPEILRIYAREAVLEDRKHVVEYATLSAYYEPEDWDELVEEELEEEGHYRFPYLRGGKVLFLNKDSIINAPQIELP